MNLRYNGLVGHSHRKFAREIDDPRGPASVFVVAGTYHQYRYAISHGFVPSQAQYVADPHHLRGIRDATILIYGTPELRRDWLEMVDLLPHYEHAGCIVRRVGEKRMF